MALLLRITGGSTIINLDDVLSAAGQQGQGNVYRSITAILRESFVAWCASPATGCWVIYATTPPHSVGRHHTYESRQQLQC